MKEKQFHFGEKTIETSSLLIRKNIMTWDNTMIQLSNISYISASNISASAFPVWAVLAIVAGLAFFSVSAVLALAFIIFGCIWIYFWYTENEKRKKGAILNIRLNCGHNLYFTFDNKEFLLKVLSVLENIIVDGSDRQVSINITDCTIAGHARVLNDLNV